MRALTSSGRCGRAAPVALCVAVIAALALTSWSPTLASAAGKHSKVVVATGSVTCTALTGEITFQPAARHIGTGSDTQTFVLHASHCKTTGSNVKKVSGVSVIARLHRPTNRCLDLLSSEPSSGTGQWLPKTIHSTTASFSGYSVVTESNGDSGFTIPNTGGRVRLTGSFAGKNHGATSRATVYVNMTAGQFVTACKSAAGLSRQIVVGGVATFS